MSDDELQAVISAATDPLNAKISTAVDTDAAAEGALGCGFIYAASMVAVVARECAERWAWLFSG